MNATMRQGLASLLVRKTEEGRVKARRSIGTWRSTIAAVQQAEKMAECKINVPTEKIQGAQRSAEQIQTANYILTAHLDNKATTERNALIATATRALHKKIEECQRTETTAKQEILRAEAIAEEEVQSATTKRDNLARWVPQEIAEAKRKQDSELRYIEGDYLRPKYYFFSSDWPDASVRGLGIAILSVVVFISSVKDYTASSLILLGFFA